jgi:F-type H+-transporting ATPase subunit c
LIFILSRRDRASCADGGNPPTKQTHIMIQNLAEISGSIQGGLGCLGAAIGVGLVGFKAAEAVGRNPGASTKILVQGIIGMALAEAVAFYALFLGK